MTNRTDSQAADPIVGPAPVFGVTDRMGKPFPCVLAGDDDEEPGPFCPACQHYHGAGEPCLCPGCGRPAKTPGGTCGRGGCG